MPYRELPLVPPGRWRSPLYVHMDARDRPGVLAQIATCFGARNVSLESMLQRPLDEQTASLVFLTHPTVEEDAQAALGAIAELDVCTAAPRVLRVLG